jgi:hypothetical protein
VIWVVTPRSVVRGSNVFEKHAALIFRVEVSGFGIHVQDYTVSRSVRKQSLELTASYPQNY